MFASFSDSFVWSFSFFHCCMYVLSTWQVLKTPLFHFIMKISSIHKNRDDNLMNPCGILPALTTLSCHSCFTSTILVFLFCVVGFLQMPCISVDNSHLRMKSYIASCRESGGFPSQSCGFVYSKAYGPLRGRGNFCLWGSERGLSISFPFRCVSGEPAGCLGTQAKISNTDSRGRELQCLSCLHRAVFPYFSSWLF